MPVKKVTVLLVEDNPGDARLFEEALRETYGPQFELTHLKTLAEALIYLAKESPDVTVLDLGLPDALGLEVIQKARAGAPTVPFVVLTGQNDEELAAQALQEGAQDYLTKGQLDARFLSRALRYAMERHKMQMAMKNESLIDELTVVYNRRGFLALAEQHAKLAHRTGKPFMVIFVDLDGMKQINDTLGHLEGDRALVETAGLLRSCLRESDILARLGGDEFAILLIGIAGNVDKIIQRRFQEKLESFNAEPGRKYKLSFSVGMVVSTAEQPYSIEELLNQADALMYKQKQDKKVAR